jgi:hypothetical protein
MMCPAAIDDQAASGSLTRYSMVTVMRALRIGAAPSMASADVSGALQCA